MAGPRVVKGGGPLPREGGSFFTGGRYLMHEKVFSLGQVRIRFFTEFILPAFRRRC